MSHALALGFPRVVSCKQDALRVGIERDSGLTFHLSCKLRTGIRSLASGVVVSSVIRDILSRGIDFKK